LRYICEFAVAGFAFEGTDQRAGNPFRTRLDNDKGLSFPSNIIIPHFICEACQVRAMVQHELTRASDRDVALMMLERMRMIDSINYWAAGTYKAYKSYLHRLGDFEIWSGAPTLASTPLSQPPRSPAISIQWAELRDSLRHNSAGERIAGNSVRKLRSAAHWFYTLDITAAFPRQTFRLTDARTVVNKYSAPTDEIGFTHFAGGLARRLGTAVTPSWTLAHVHIKWIDDRLNEMFLNTDQPDGVRHDIAIAGFFNLLAWLGWLRGTEMGEMTSDEVDATAPEDGRTLGLPAGVGALLFRLLKETKTNPTMTADVVVAWKCISGLSIGLWFTRMLQFEPHENGYLLASNHQSRWSSRYFRKTYAWPLLEAQRLTGEPTLKAFTTVEGNRISDKVYALHSWRRGGRSRCQREPREDETTWCLGLCRVKADVMQVYEHGRWRLKNQGKETMIQHYNEWEVLDRVVITLVSM
jgi:hypothetical protein